MRFGLTDKTIEKIHSVFEKHPEVEEVIIYGSRAIGNFREGSDIDITLVGPELSAAIRSKICLEIDQLNTPYLFDVSVLSMLNSPDLIAHIQRVGEVFYTKQNNHE